jgi:hypothetical protein
MKKKTIVYWVFLEGLAIGLCGLGAYFIPIQLLNQPSIVSFFIYAILTQIIIALNILRHPEASEDDLYQFEEEQK